MIDAVKKCDFCSKEMKMTDRSMVVVTNTDGRIFHSKNEVDKAICPDCKEKLIAFLDTLGQSDTSI